MSTNNSTEKAVAQMTSQSTMVRRIQRKRDIALISNPLSASVLNVSDDLKTTIWGTSFCAFESGKEDPNRFIIFTKLQNLVELDFSAKWPVDGTIAVCFSLSCQLYRVHGVIKDITAPLVYSLIRSKLKSTENCWHYWRLSTFG